MLSNVVASDQSAAPWARQTLPAAITLSQAALNSSQVFGGVIPSSSSTFFELYSQFTRWMFIGAATQLPVGFITEISSGATTASQPSAAARSSRLAVLPVASHSAISGPFSCTAAGAVPATTSDRSLARVFEVCPEIAVCSQVPPAAVNISPSLAMAAASDPCAHWCIMLVLGSACSASVLTPNTAVAATARRSGFLVASITGSSLVFGKTISGRR